MHFLDFIVTELTTCVQLQNNLYIFNLVFGQNLNFKLL